MSDLVTKAVEVGGDLTSLSGWEPWDGQGGWTGIFQCYFDRIRSAVLPVVE